MLLHRDPAVLCASVCSLIAYIRKMKEMFEKMRDGTLKREEMVGLLDVVHRLA